MVKRGAGDDGEAWLRREGVCAADDGCDGVVASERFSEGEGACAAAGTKEEDPHCICCLVDCDSMAEEVCFKASLQLVFGEDSQPGAIAYLVLEARLET